MNKKSARYILRVRLSMVLVLVFMSTFSALFVVPKKAYADTGLNTLCVPNYTEAGGDHWKPNGWLKIDVVSRFIITITYTPSGNCKEPSDLDSKYIRIDQTEFGPFINQSLKLNLDRVLGNFVLSQLTGDISKIEQLHYEVPVAASASKSKDESRVDRLDWSAVPGAGIASEGSLWSSFQKIDSGGIDKFFNKAEYTIGIEEDLIKDVTCSGTNNNMHLGNLDGDGRAVKWFCSSDGADGTGAYINETLTGKQNFNITFIISPDGKKLIPAFPETIAAPESATLLNKFTFTYCNNKYINDGCNGDYSVSGMTPEQAVAVADGIKDLEIKVTDGKTINIVAGGPSSAALVQGQSLASSAGLGSAGGNEPPSCESSGFSLSWLFCGIVNALAEATDKVHDNMLLPLLKNPRIDTADSTSGTYKAWTSFRNIANIILLFGLLFVVFGQAVGMDAYTAKKMMPRVLVAAILINLSYYLIAIANDITALLGSGIASLIKAPFVLNGDFTFSFSGAASGTVGGLGLAALFGVGALTAGGVASVGIWGVLGGVGSFLFAFILLPVFLAVLGAAVTLILRRGILLLLILISPVAFALIAIPGGDKYFKKYRELLFSTLLVYPLFEAIWAISQVLAVTINKANGNDSSFGVSIIGLVGTMIALFAPLFLIPFAFKIAGGVLGTIGAVANDRGKGLIDGRKKAQAERRAHNMHRFREGDLFNKDARVGRGLDRVGRGVGAGAAGRFGFGRRGEAHHDLHARAAAEDAIKNNAALRQLAYDDNGIAVMALSGGTAEGARRAALQLQAANGWTDDQRERALASAATAGYSGTNAVAAMTLMAQNKSRALGGLLKGEAGMELVRQSATQVSGGNEQMVENLMGGFSFNSRAAGRLDFGGEFAGESLVNGWRRSSVGQHAQSYGASLEAFSEQFVPLTGPSMLQAVDATGAADIDTRRSTALALMEMQNMLPNATGQNQEIINETLARAGIDHTLGTSVEEQLAVLSGGAITAADIRGQARVYDAQTPQAGRDGQQPPQPTPPAGP